MVYEMSKNMLNQLLNDFLKTQKDTLETFDTHIKKIQEEEKKELEKKVSDAKNLVEINTNEIETLKKDSKILNLTKDERNAQIKEKQTQINDLKSKIEDYQKNLSKFKENFEKRIKGYDKVLKKLYDNIVEFLNISTKINLETLLETSEEHLKYIIQINDMVTLENFIQSTQLDVKIKTPHNIVKIANFKQYMAIFLEIMIYYNLELLSNEKILKNKQDLAERALSYAKGALNYANDSKDINVDYFIDLEKFCESELISIIAQREISSFNLANATSYCLYAKDLLNSLKNLGDNFKSIISEKANIMEGWASDAYNLIYLFNSYKSWAKVANSNDSEIRELAQITKEKIENFITSQYGFPKEDTIKKITIEIVWPSPLPPSIIKEIVPKY